LRKHCNESLGSPIKLIEALLKEMELEPMGINEKESVTELLKKAVTCDKSEDAMRFAQSALNAAHALQVVQIVEQTEKDQG